MALPARESSYQTDPDRIFLRSGKSSHRIQIERRPGGGKSLQVHSIVDPRDTQARDEPSKIFSHTLGIGDRNGASPAQSP